MTAIEDAIISAISNAWDVNNAPKPIMQKYHDSLYRDLSNSDYLIVREVKVNAFVSSVDGKVYDKVYDIEITLASRSENRFNSIVDEYERVALLINTSISGITFLDLVSIENVSNIKVPRFVKVYTYEAEVLG